MGIETGLIVILTQLSTHDNRMARYLVTGGAGFIGSNIVEELLKRGEFVRVLDNFSTGRRINLMPFLKDIDLHEGDIRYYHSVRKATRDVDYVLHQAALPSVPRSIADPITTNEVNVTGTLNLLHAAHEAHVRRFIYASSSSVYGDNPESPKHEAMLINPKSPYAVSKLTGEFYCKIFSRLYSLETVCLRYFNVFGPRQDPNSQYSAVIPRFIKALLHNQSPVIYGDGTQSRDFTYVKNNVEACLAACEAPHVAGKVFNIACGATYSLLDLLQSLNQIMGKAIKPVFEPARPGDIKHSMASIDKAREHLMYKPVVDFHTGLKLTVQAFEK